MTMTLYQKDPDPVGGDIPDGAVLATVGDGTPFLLVPVEPDDIAFTVALHSFDGGLWQFHAVDGPEDGEPTHIAFEIGAWRAMLGIGGDE